MVTIVHWEDREAAKLDPTSLGKDWRPRPYTLTNGETLKCPYDFHDQPSLMYPAWLDLHASITWATRLRMAYEQEEKRAFAPAGGNAPYGYPDEEPGSQIYFALGFRAGQAREFAAAVGQHGRFDFQRPPGTDLFLAFYTSFASYHFGLVGRYAGFTMDHLMEGGGFENRLSAFRDRVVPRAGHKWLTTRIDTGGTYGLTRLNEWCVRRAFDDVRNHLVP